MSETDEKEAKSMTFHRTIVVIEILSDVGPVDGDDVLASYEPAMSGDCSGTVLSSDTTEINGAQAAALLTLQGSDPDFFGLNSDGTAAGDYLEREGGA